MKFDFITLKFSFMPDNNDKQKGTDRDVRPQQGQKSNENWDDNEQSASDTSAGRSSDARRTDEETNTTGAASSQRNREDNVGPLESDMEQLPSEKRRDRGSNLTGPGLG
jgi:hypothetical protein